MATAHDKFQHTLAWAKKKTKKTTFTFGFGRDGRKGIDTASVKILFIKPWPLSPEGTL